MDIWKFLTGKYSKHSYSVKCRPLHFDSSQLKSKLKSCWEYKIFFFLQMCIPFLNFVVVRGYAMKTKPVKPIKSNLVFKWHNRLPPYLDINEWRSMKEVVLICKTKPKQNPDQTNQKSLISQTTLKHAKWYRWLIHDLQDPC